MKLWLISQDENSGYDTYDAAVVAAETEDEAKKICPRENSIDCWTDPKNVWVEFLGEAAPGIESGIILASFNAG